MENDTSAQALIETLERWLALAREGKLIGLLAVSEDSSKCQQVSYGFQHATAIGYCQMLIHQLLKEWLSQQGTET